MAELMVLLQALLLVAGWLLFLRAQAELRAQTARQSLTGELEELRQTLEALLTRLMEEADRAEQSLRLLQAMNLSPPPSLSYEERKEAQDSPSPFVGEKGLGEEGLASNLSPPPSLSCEERKEAKDSPSPFVGEEGLGEEGFPLPESGKNDSGYNLFQQERPAFSAVAQLAQEGLSLSEIARRTGYALGEVELILNLNRRHSSEE